MTSRPTVTVHGADGKPGKDTHTLPAVFKAPIRPDIVQYAQTKIGDNEECLTLRQDRPHRHGKEQEATVCCEREGGPPNEC
jgi:hypothetical protein